MEKKKQLKKEKVNFEKNKAVIEKNTECTKKIILKTELNWIAKKSKTLAMNKNSVKNENDYINELTT